MTSKELIPDGNAADQPDSDFDPKQLAMGVKVELEHTKNKALAKEIAKDHLAEIPDYYTKLIKMEREASNDFKSFDDPWKVMSEEDRKEANRLFKAVMKAFPSSPKQKELSDKLQAILKKYGLGNKKGAYPMAPEPEKINLKERWDNKEWNKLDGAPDEDVLTQPLRFREDYMDKNSYYRRNTFYKNDPFWMTSKYGGNCRKCSEAIKKGEEIWYYPKDKLAYCEKCGKEAEKDFLSAVEDEEFYNRQYSEKLRKIASSLSGFRGAVIIMGEHGVAVAEKGGKIYTAPLDGDQNFEFSKMEELKDPKSPAFLKEVNKVFGKKLKIKDFEKSASINPWEDPEDNPEAIHWKLDHDEDEEDFWYYANKFFGSDWEAVPHYSGRGMMGRKSPCALSTESSPHSPEGKKFLKESGAYVDSLGKGFVYYLK